MSEKGVKLSVMLSVDSVEDLRRYAKAHGITMTEGIRRALGFQMFIDKEISKGSKILLEKNSGELRILTGI